MAGAARWRDGAEAMRRRLLLAAALLPATARAALPDLAFRVLRDGREVGTHRVVFRDQGGALVVASALRIQVRLAGFTVFRFTQDTEEAWRGDRLAALESRSDRNGRPGFCEARGERAGLRLRGVGGEVVLPPNAAPMTWWRVASLAPGVPLFDVREGRAVVPRIERLPASAGQRIRVTAGETTEVLYDADGTWAGFTTIGDDGSTVRYEPV
jgi:hypothetical protein